MRGISYIFGGEEGRAGSVVYGVLSAGDLGKGKAERRGYSFKVVCFSGTVGGEGTQVEFKLLSQVRLE